MIAFRFDIWWWIVGSLFWIASHCDVISEELSLLNKAAEVMTENAGGNSESGLLMLSPNETQTGDVDILKPTYGRLRRDLWPDVKNKVNKLMREIAKEALMLKAVFNSALTGNQPVEKKKVFITVTPPRASRIHGSASVASKHKSQTSKNKPNSKSVQKPSIFKFFDDSLLKQIEKREEERAEASLFNKNEKKNNFESGGIFPVQVYNDTVSKGKQPLKSQIVSNLNTNVMDQPLGKKIIYEKQIIPLKLTTENYPSPNYKESRGFEPVYKQAETVNNPIAVSFNKDFNCQNHKQNQQKNQNCNQRPGNHQLEVPNYSIDTYYNVPNKESTFKITVETSPKVQQYDIPNDDSNDNYFVPTLKPWYQQRLKKNTDSSPTPTAKIPSTTTTQKATSERPNYPEFFFESRNNGDKLRDQNYKQQQSRDSVMRHRPNDRRFIQNLTTTATSILNTNESSQTKRNHLKSLKNTQSEFHATVSTKQQINTTNMPSKRGTIKYDYRFNN